MKKIIDGMEFQVCKYCKDLFDDDKELKKHYRQDHKEDIKKDGKGLGGSLLNLGKGLYDKYAK